MYMTMIQKGLPVPPERPGRKPSGKYDAIAQLEAGDSVAFPLSEYGRVSTMLAYYGRRLDRKFTRRTEGQSVRVWRMK